MKYFVISDIHSFYTSMKKALWKAGYRKTNKDHCLIICGDLFDRGDESKEVYDFIMSIPSKRRILIRGNHENLLVDAIQRGNFEEHDYHNGTNKTVEQFMGYVEKLDDVGYDYRLYKTLEREMILEFRKSDIFKFIEDRNNWLDWYELNDKYIFVHSFIPLMEKPGQSSLALYYNPQYTYDANWRNTKSIYDIDAAKWGNPAKLYKAGYFSEEEKAGKTLVCGHFHTSYMYALLNDDDDKEDCPIYYSPHFIGIDACTVVTEKTNVLVIDGDDLYDQDGNKLN